MSSVENLDDSGTNEFLVSLVVNLVLGVVFLFATSVCRRRIPYFFDARRVDHIRNPSYRPGKLYLERPPRQSSSLFGWIPQIVQMNERLVMKTAGVDAVITLRFFLWMAVYLSVYTIIAFLIIIPIQATADGADITGFNSLSVMALGTGDNRLYAHMIVIYVFTALLFIALRQMWLDNIQLKSKWISNEQLCGRKMTILLNDIPQEYQNDDKLFAFFEELYPGKVDGASIVKQTPELIALYEERETLVNEINHAKGVIELEIDDDILQKYHRMQQSPDSEQHEIDERSMKIIQPRKKLGCLGCTGEEVDLFTYNFSRISEIEEKMFEIYGKRDELPTYPAGFVTFNSAVTAASVIDVPIGRLNEFTTRWAPEVNDLLWFGIQKPPLYKIIMTVFMAVLHFFIVFFYMIPVGFVSSLMTLQSLSQRLPFLEPVLTFHPIVKGFLEGFLPSLAMVIFMALLPVILAVMGRLTGLESVSWVQQYVFRKYFVFQLFNFFLITAVSSSVFNQIDEIINNPTSIPTLLAKSLPQSAGLFVNYIMLRAFSANLNLFDIDIVIAYVLAFFARTPKAYVEAFAPGPFKFGKEFPESILILIIAFCFGTIQPIILPFAAIYFFTSYFRNKYRFVYMAVTPYESGGGFWPLAFNRIVFGVIIAQLTLIGILALKENFVAAALLVPLPFLSILYWYIYHDLYTATGHRLTLVDSSVTDKTLDVLTDEQRQALTEGHDLPLPLHSSILPFIMPDRVADTIQRDNYIKRRQRELAESGVNATSVDALQTHQQQHENSEPLTASIDQNGDESSSTHDARGNATGVNAGGSPVIAGDLQLTLEQETQLSEQYYGDDIELQRGFRKFISTCQLDPSIPVHQIYDEYKRLYFEELDRSGLSTSQPQTPMSISRSGAGAGASGGDGDDDVENQHGHKYSPPIDHRIVIEKAVLRWRQSQKQKQKVDEAQEVIAKALDQQSSTASDQLTPTSPIRSASISVSESHIVPKQFTFDQQKSDPTPTSPTIAEDNDGEEVVVENTAPEITLSPGSATSLDADVLSPPAVQRNRSVSIRGINGPVVIDEHRLRKMGTVMKRYYQPELNDSTYSSIQDIIWGATYLDYYRKTKKRK